MIKKLLLLCIFPLSVLAQSDSVMVLSLKEAEAVAFQNNPHYQAQLKNIGVQKGIYWAEMMPENPEIGIEMEEIPNSGVFKNYNK